MRITDNLYMLSGAAYGLVGNVYAIRNEEKLVLIDTGKEETALGTVKESLEYHRLTEYPVTHVLLTHMHNDHAGNAWYFRELGAEIIASESDASGVESGGLRTNETGWIKFRTCKVDRTVKDNEVLTLNGIDYTCMLMPGHTNGSLFFLFNLDGKSMVATGDTVIPVPGPFDDGFELGTGWGCSLELDKQKYMETLKRAIDIHADVLLSGHGIPVMKNGSDIFRRTFFKAYASLRG